MGKRKRGEERLGVAVTDYRLAVRVWELMRNADLDKLTYKDVRKELEAYFGQSLRHEKERIERCLERSYNRRMFLERRAAKQNGQEKVEARQTQEQVGNEGEREGVCRWMPKNLKKPKNKDPLVKPSQFCRVTPELQVITGEPVLRRTEIVKRLFQYVRDNKLRDPDDKLMVICKGNQLYDLFKVDSINYFQMNKALQRHFLKLRGEEHKEYENKDGRTAPAAIQTSGLLAPYPISEALTTFFSTDRTSMSRAEVIRGVWDYIHYQGLQVEDENEHIIRCDGKLEQLLSVLSCRISSLPKLLERHFLKEAKKKINKRKPV